MTVTREAQFTASEIRSAIAVVRLGHAVDVPEPLRDLAEGIVLDSAYIYRITEADLNVYIEEGGGLSDRQRTFFMQRARDYIESTSTFGESLQVCLDLAFTDALGEDAD